MNKIPSIAIYDVGKTNKKLILFDEQYTVVYEESIQLAETKDEDGFSCEDVVALTIIETRGRRNSGQRRAFYFRSVRTGSHGHSSTCTTVSEASASSVIDRAKNPLEGQIGCRVRAGRHGERPETMATRHVVLAPLPRSTRRDGPPSPKHCQGARDRVPSNRGIRSQSDPDASRPRRR